MDLVYGHLGEPVYDSTAKTWHFTRDAQSKRYLHLLRPLMDAKETGPRTSFDGEVRQLQRAFPGIDHKMLQELLLSSEAVELAASQHDPTVSDLIAYGNVMDETVIHKATQIRYMPVVAVASGAAGELLRLTVLHSEILGWDDHQNVKIKIETAQNGLEGWWKGNGSRIQQIAFAAKKQRGSSMLAVRTQEGISFLDLEVRTSPVFPHNSGGRIQSLPSSRLEAGNVFTLTPADMSGVSFADISFDPWNFRRFAIVNQAGHWQIWNMKRGIENIVKWAPFKEMNGASKESDGSTEKNAILDGWVRALWAVDSETLVIASRIAFTIFDIKNGRANRSEVDLGLAKNNDWILDVKRCPNSQRHLLVVTSSRISLMEIHGAKQSSAERSTAIVLVSWIHFRSKQDISLSLYVKENNERNKDSNEDIVIATLYSRLNGLASNFSFRYSKVASQASSAFDPCLLPLPGIDSLPQDPRKAKEAPRLQNLPLCLDATPLPIIHWLGVEHPELFDRLEFFLLRVLDHDWSFSEHLYVASHQPDLFIEAPSGQRHGAREKTPANVMDDFIVPDGVLDDSASDFDDDDKTAHALQSPDETNQQDMRGLNSDVPTKRPIYQGQDMQWLVERIRDKYGDPVALPFHDILEVIQEGVAEKLNGVKTGPETILEIGGEDPSITDIDEAAVSLSTLFESLVPSMSDMKKGKMISKDHDPILVSLLPYISDDWNSENEIDLLKVYESFVKSEISSLTANVPSRVRLRIEKRLRSVAAQIFLAAHTVSVRINALSAEEVIEQAVTASDSALLLPVREKDFMQPFPIQATSVANQAPSLSQPSASQSQKVRFQTLPEEPETSDTDHESTEDPSSVYLRSLVSIAPQRRLPPKLSNILTHWRVGEDPAFYDWEASQRAIALPDDENIVAESMSQDRNRRKAKKRTRSIMTAGNLADKTLVQSQGESSGQPAPKRALDVSSQQAPPILSSSQMMPESSQARGPLTVSSQPVPGKFAGREKSKKGRKKGF